MMRFALLGALAVVALPLAQGERLLEADLGKAGDVEQNMDSQGNPQPPVTMDQLRVLRRGDLRDGEGFLIPDLVPPPGFTYEFKNKEKPAGIQWFAEGVDTNAYGWKLEEIFANDGSKWKFDQYFAQLQGKWQSNSFGHKSVHVYNMAGEEMFKIRMAKHVMNPLKLRWSFRILPPGSKDNDDSLFTINKDVWGKGFLWKKEEWRIYRGRERDDDMIYYAIGSWIGWDYKFYRSRKAYKEGDRRVLATIKQKRNAGAILGHNALPDKFTLKVTEGQDSALLLAVSTIIDMVHDSEGSSEALVHRD